MNPTYFPARIRRMASSREIPVPIRLKIVRHTSSRFPSAKGLQNSPAEDEAEFAEPGDDFDSEGCDSSSGFDISQSYGQNPAIVQIT